MFRIDVRSFIALQRELGELEEGSREDHSEADVDRALDKLDNLTTQSSLLGLGVSTKHASELLAKIHQTGTLDHLSNEIGHLRRTIERDLEARIVFALLAGHEDYADASKLKLHGHNRAIAEAFPNLSFDLHEGSMCIGLSRYTAGVFHLMRALEEGVQILASHFGVAKVDKEWGKLLSEINGEISKLKRSERNKWSEVCTSLWHVKEAWRNPTMHPGSNFNFEEAEEIFQATLTFLRKLAEKVSNG